MPFTLGDFRELTDHLPDETELTATPSLDEDMVEYHVSEVYVDEDDGSPRVILAYNDEITVIS